VNLTGAVVWSPTTAHTERDRSTTHPSFHDHIIDDLE
jgi:hypothetical protein